MKLIRHCLFAIVVRALPAMFLVLLATNAHAQQFETGQVVADIIEDLSSQAESEQDYSELTELLYRLADNPININLIMEAQLKEMLFLNNFQIGSLLDYRDSLGTIYSIYELMGVPGFDVVDLQRLSQFVTFKRVEDTSINLAVRGRSQLALKFRTQVETPAGYKNSYSGTKYQGDKNSFFIRYSYRAGKHIEVGLTAEKDPGEPFFDGTFSTGVDYLSGFIRVKSIRWLKNLVIGNYKAAFGQGLTVWNGLTFGKSGDPLGVEKRASGILPHASAYESQYLQGVGATFGFGQFETTFFGSYRKIDAGIEDTLQNGDFTFRSFPETGYHRTTSEIANRNVVPEFVAGVNALYNLKRARFGITFAHSQIDGVLARDLAIYELSQKPLVKNVLGADFRSNIHKHSLFGEVAIDVDSGAVAAVVGGLFRVSNVVQISLLGRTYSKKFNSRYTAGFAEGSTTNENGFYMGLSFLPMAGWKMSTYVDLFSFPWLRYGVNSPSYGREFMLVSEHSLGQNLNLHIRYRYKQKEANLSESGSVTTLVVMQTAQSLRLQLNFSPTTNMSMKTSLNGSSFGNDSVSTEFGYLIAQDIGYKFTNRPLSVNFRFAIFDTHSWNSRIYSYESDMLYAFSVPAYYSKGSRYFVLLKYSPIPWLDIWLRYSQSYYGQFSETGTGPDKIVGNTRSEIKAMVRLKF